MAPVHNHPQKSVTKTTSTSKSTAIQPVHEPASEPSRQFVACNQCRAGGLKCSLKHDQQGPCSQCKKFGETCKFVNMRKRDTLPASLCENNMLKIQTGKPQVGTTLSSTTRHTFSGVVSKPRTTSSQKLKDVNVKPKLLISQPFLQGKTLGIGHIIITTCFAHPIRFHYMPDPDNLFPCSWCDSPVFGLWGYSPRKVEVIHFPDIGFEEISGGHGAEGKEPSRMCGPCTHQRVCMFSCQRHIIKRLVYIEPQSLDIEALSSSMIALTTGDMEGSKLIQRVKWCSICVAPAEFKCCTRVEGCGLHLCRTCADLLERLVGSSTPIMGNSRILDQLVKLWKDDSWKRANSGELRADTDFLLTTGELFKRMNHGMRCSKYDEDPLERKYKEMKVTRRWLPPVENNPHQSASQQVNVSHLSSSSQQANMAASQNTPNITPLPSLTPRQVPCQISSLNKACSKKSLDYGVFDNLYNFRDTKEQESSSTLDPPPLPESQILPVAQGKEGVMLTPKATPSTTPKPVRNAGLPPHMKSIFGAQSTSNLSPSSEIKANMPIIDRRRLLEDSKASKHTLSSDDAGTDLVISTTHIPSTRSRESQDVKINTLNHHKDHNSSGGNQVTDLETSTIAQTGDLMKCVIASPDDTAATAVVKNVQNSTGGKSSWDGIVPKNAEIIDLENNDSVVNNEAAT